MGKQKQKAGGKAASKAASKAVLKGKTKVKAPERTVGAAKVIELASGFVAVQEGDKVVSVKSSDGSFFSTFTSCSNGPGHQMQMWMGGQTRDRTCASSILREGTFKNGKQEGAGTCTVRGQNHTNPIVFKGMFKDGELAGLGTQDGREVFFKGDGFQIVKCLTPMCFFKYFSGSKTELLEHYTAITGGPPPAGGRFVKQMRRALIDEHYSAEQLRALGNLRGHDNTSAVGLRAMLKSSAVMASLL
jgi:hypothetical protein